MVPLLFSEHCGRQGVGVFRQGIHVRKLRLTNPTACALMATGILCLFLVAWRSSSASAQAATEPAAPLAETMPTPTPSTDPQATKTPASSGVKVEEVKPNSYKYRDEDGELVELPDITYEEVRRLIDFAKGSKTPPPAYSLRTLNLNGRVEGAKVDLTVDVTILVPEQNEDWIRVPLRFNNAVLRELPTYKGEGEFFLDSQPEGDGYVAWIKGAKQTEHKLQCHFTAAVQELGTESRLALVTPRGAVTGTLVLEVPLEGVKASIIRTTDEPIRAESIKPQGGGKTKIELPTPVGEFQLAWRPWVEGTQTVRQVLRAENSQIQIKLEGKRRITAKANLKVSSFGAPIESFSVRLPPGMRLASSEHPGMQVTVLEPELDPATSRLSHVVEVRLNEKTRGPIEVPLTAELVRENGVADVPIEVGGFEIIDAVKQFGAVELIVEGDLSAVWVEGANIRRIDDTSTADPRPLARFEYDAQPFKLQVQVVPKRTRISVEPTHVVYADSRQLRLEATLKYKVRGAKAYSVDYDFTGWTVDRVSPDNLVQSEALLLEKVSPLSIPLASTALPSSGEFELRIQAHRDLTEQEKEILFDVPRPIGALLTPGSLVVVPADNVELTPRGSVLQGLTPDPLPAMIKLPPRQQTPLYYRELGGGATARFAADFVIRERTVTVAATADARLDAQRVQVEQRFTYNVAYEPLRHLEFDVARNMWEAGEVQVSLAGKPLPAVLEPPADEEVAGERARIHVDLLTEHIGSLEVLVRYAMPLPEVSGEAPVSYELPLVHPLVEGVPQKTSTVVRLSTDSALEAVAQGEGWTSNPSFSAGTTAEPIIQWRHATGAPPLTLALSIESQATRGQVIVDKAWVQTWLTSAGRQDRAVFAVTTAAPQLLIELPDEILEATLEVAVDGRRQPSHAFDAAGMLAVELPRTAQRESRVVEIWYEFADGRPDTGAMQLAAPLLRGALPARRMYWQLVLPGDEHLLTGPGGMASDMAWRWRGTHWGRTGTLSQRALEEWSGASTQLALPSGANDYLFSTFGNAEELQLHTASRRNLLLACSGVVLVVGLAVIYLPVLRHPAVLFAVAIGLVTAGAWLPELGIMIAQAAALGVGCVLLARLLQTAFGPRRMPAAPQRSVPLSSVEGKSTEPHLRYEPGSHATTATAPMAYAATTEGEAEP